MSEPQGPASEGRDLPAIRWAAAWEELRPILDAISDHVWVATARVDRVLYSNRSFEEIYGLPVDELFADPRGFLRLLDPADRKLVESLLSTRTPTSSGEELHLTRDDGSRRTIRIRNFPILDQDGSVVALAGITEDVSLQAQLRAELETTQNRLAGILESTSDGIIATDRDWRCTYANRNAGVLLAREPSALIGRDLWTEFPEAIGEHIADVLRAVMSTRVAENVETYFRPTERWFMVRVFPSDEGLVIVFHDTSDSRRAAIAQRSQLQILERANVIAVGADDGLIRFWNEGAADLYGYSTKAAIGQPIQALLNTVFDESLEKIFATLHRVGTWQGTLTHTTSDGRAVTVASRWILHEDPKGDGGVVIEVNNDITELLASQNEAARLRTELHRAERLDALGQIADGVAHDFNNLLSVILNNLDFALEQVEPESAAGADIKSAASAAKRAVALTRQLLIFARSDDADVGNIDLDAVVTDLAAMLAQILGNHIELQIDLGHTGEIVHVDPTRVEHILLNLTTNARDAMSRGGTLTIATSVVEVDHQGAPLAAGRYLALVVSDNGTGMSEDSRARAFEPFFTTKPVGLGTGLGLPTVFAAAVQAGGTASIRSAPGRGTTVSVWLPCAGADGVPDSNAPPSPPPSPPLATVLLIEGDADLRRTIKRILESEQYRVVDVVDPSAARSAWASQYVPFHAVIAHMGVSGAPIDELIEEFRLESPRFPVVLTSGNERAGRADIAPPALFLAKPFTQEQLIEALQQVLGDTPEPVGDDPTR